MNDTQRIKKANELVSYVSETMELEKIDGKDSYRGHCFRCDNGGNFEVSFSKQLFKCWLCGIGGDVIRYAAYKQGISYAEAKLQLAARAGIKIKKRTKFMSEINPRNLWYGVFIPDWLLLREEVSHGAKICYARLCRYYNPATGQCNPKIKTLARGIGMKERMARKYINELIEHCLIKTKKGNGTGKPNSYAFLKHKWFASALTKKKHAHQEGEEEQF